MDYTKGLQLFEEMHMKKGKRHPRDRIPHYY